MLKLAVPLFHVGLADEAKDFYCDKLGFTLDFALGRDGLSDPCYMGVSRDSVRLHLSSFPGDGRTGSIANIVVDDMDALHAEFSAKGVESNSGHPVGQTWGTREMYIRDIDGNWLRFQQLAAGEDKGLDRG